MQLAVPTVREIGARFPHRSRFYCSANRAPKMGPDWPSDSPAADACRLAGPRAPRKIGGVARPQTATRRAIAPSVAGVTRAAIGDVGGADRRGREKGTEAADAEWTAFTARGSCTRPGLASTAHALVPVPAEVGGRRCTVPAITHKGEASVCAARADVACHALIATRAGCTRRNRVRARPGRVSAPARVGSVAPEPSGAGTVSACGGRCHAHLRAIAAETGSAVRARAAPTGGDVGGTGAGTTPCLITEPVRAIVAGVAPLAVLDVSHQGALAVRGDDPLRDLSAGLRRVLADAG